jgi:hypothetical protein
MKRTLFPGKHAGNVQPVFKPQSTKRGVFLLSLDGRQRGTFSICADDPKSTTRGLNTAQRICSRTPQSALAKTTNCSAEITTRTQPEQQ